MKLYVVAIILASLSTAYSKIIPKCELARMLFNFGFPISQIPDLVCIAQNESGFNTGAVNARNPDGSMDYGMFQINNRYWCSSSSVPGKDCKMTCAALVDENITDDLKCVKIIYNRHGFSAWVAWVNKCKGKPLPSIAECFSG